ncbi:MULTISPECIES: FkbM family methyltransferase [Pasteurellaceae]|uniref:FkbM family methyltransferase n=1 Tax=Pasteurella atlantica TaxID=2827233 RepID=A0AAW8CQC8_9PAST|nr:FkbM family methyltransferase [Pasteurella atlantica]MDP8040173.1 FkbM family methyltransferase [Pasteurella atlantica]MDP8044479.1 FkbM family methyltransferase [Pasteurella atlantica]MDP8046509.1 FkbM family methyltransferase [Pasteurella atlantica]MDP8090057.1 FkbM family methyltransferase [Pasteurella atlantica]MDP8123341.1 FkbM family methyltransferase [Pasteurella atlantica]
MQHATQKLIYDVGMCQGEDTDFYLKKGFNVIGFEANPSLVKQCKIRFKNAIQTGQLIIIEGAIIDFKTSDLGNNTNYNVIFFKNNQNPVWGTVVKEWAIRNAQVYSTSSETIEVPAINFSECLAQYGIPYYLKIDIEGMDLACLKALLDFEQRPDYISLESEKTSFEKLILEIKLLKKLGYDHFQAINQMTIPQQKEPCNTQEGHYVKHLFPFGSSGLFGRDLPNNWKTDSQIFTQYQKIFRGYELFGDNGKLRGHPDFEGILAIVNEFAESPIPGWYNTHAKHQSVLG